MAIEIRSPETVAEKDAYYRLRWEILRKPWNQPPGSERDEHEGAPETFHAAAFDGGRVIGVGRVHFNSPGAAQVRYMAVHESARGKNIGGGILRALEEHAKANGAKTITLNSRNTAVPFYEKQGYRVDGSAPTMFGEVEHSRMSKTL